MATLTLHPQIQIELATEAANPTLRWSDSQLEVKLERTDEHTWHGSAAIPSGARSVPFVLDVGEPVDWSLTFRRGDEPLLQLDNSGANSPARVAGTLRPDVAAESESRGKHAHKLFNQTPYRLSIDLKDGGPGGLQIAPWSEREIDAGQWARLDLDPWLSRGLMRAHELVRGKELIASHAALGGVLGVPFWAVVIALVWGAVGTLPQSYWTWAVIVMIVAIVFSLFVLLKETGRIDVVLRLLRRMAAAVKSTFNFFVTLAIAFGIPAMVIIRQDTFAQAESIGRLLQLVLIGTLSAMPALLYYLFDRRKLSGLRQRFFQSMVKLDPDLRTLDNAQRVHGLRAEQTLGPPREESWKPLAQGTRHLVIMVATLVCTAGWLLTLNPVGVDPAAGGALRLVDYVQPVKDPFVFAFLGGYAFGLWMLLRRYFRSDLKPEAYGHLVTRIVGAVVITWAVAQVAGVFGGAQTETAGAAGGSNVFLGFAFMIGWMPETGLLFLKEVLQKRFAGKVLTDFQQRLPLQRLEGIDLYNRARLMDEGIENIENVAHCDLVDLMLQTRIPLETLLDWIDQSVLILHVGGEEANSKQLDVLRDHGIRTATDLMASFEAARKRDRGAELLVDLPDGTQALVQVPNGGHDRTGAFLSLLGSQPDGPPRIQVIMDAIRDDPWMRVLERARMPSPTTVVSASMLSAWDQGERSFLHAIAEIERSQKPRPQVTAVVSRSVENLERNAAPAQ